jgi:protein-disulfide isomerase
MSATAVFSAARLHQAFLLLALVLSLGGCKKPCKEGKADAAWTAEPLSKLMLKDATVCEGSNADRLVMWKGGRVHDANMEAVGNAQSSGWDRLRDNWYPKPGDPPTKDFDSAKWSELSGHGSLLRIDVSEEGGGALVTMMRMPGDPAAGAEAAPRPGKARPSAAPKADDGTIHRIPVGDSPQRGAADALVTLVVFSDFQCPFCARLNPTFEELLAAYPGKLRIVWKHRPLAFHKRAEPASNLAIEAGKQKGPEAFWKAHDLLFKNTRALEDADLEKYAAELGLDAAKAKAAITTRPYAATIAADGALADGLGVTGTPQTFVNGKRLTGAQPVAKFRAVIDEQLAVAAALVAKGTAPKDVYEALQKDAKAP